MIGENVEIGLGRSARRGYSLADIEFRHAASYAVCKDLTTAL